MTGNSLDRIYNRLNLLFVADVSIENVFGGAERCLYEQCTRMSQRGHNVHVLTRRLKEHKRSHESIDGVNEWRYDCQLRNPATFFKTTILNAKKLFELLQIKYLFNCIIFHQPFSALGVILSKFSNSLPKIYMCHSLSFEEYISRNKNKNGFFQSTANTLQIQLRKKIEKYGLYKSNNIVVLSEFTRNKLSKVYKIADKKMKVIPGGVDLEKFHPTGDKAEIRKNLTVPVNKVILFTVRNLVQRMGLENLIIAFKQLNQKHNDIYLVIGGKGPLINELSDLSRSLRVENGVNLAGFIADDLLPLYYQMADLFVLPSRELEGFGLVTLEAMSSGLPVVGTAVGGTEEILAKFDSSFLFQGTDPHSITELIAEKVHLIKSDTRKWQETSIRCRQFVKKHYSWEKNIDALEKLITKTLPN